MSEHENEGNVEQSACCNVCSDGGCSIGRSGWKWSLFTLAALIIAGVATATVLAGEKEEPKSGRCCGAARQSAAAQPFQGASGEAEAAAKSCEAGAKAACTEAKALGVSGEKEAQEGKSCPVKGAKDSGCCPSKASAAQQGAASEKEASEGKACCSEKKDCGSKTKV